MRDVLFGVVVVADFLRDGRRQDVEIDESLLTGESDPGKDGASVPWSATGRPGPGFYATQWDVNQEFPASGPTFVPLKGFRKGSGWQWLRPRAAA